MPKPNLLVLCPSDHYILRNLQSIQDLAEIQVGSDLPFLQREAANAEIILYSGLTGKSATLQEIWPYAKKVRWVHSLSAGVEKILFPELVESPVVLTNARGVFKRSLAEFAVLGMLYFYKRVRRLVENQRSHRWDDFFVDMRKLGKGAWRQNFCGAPQASEWCWGLGCGSRVSPDGTEGDVASGRYSSGCSTADAGNASYDQRC
jgi:phosphoglycerate dehydrogenase-like enzyme